MKKIIPVLFLAVIFTSPALVVGAVSTSSASPSARTKPAEGKAQELLDRVATKVAEMTAQLRRTYGGKISSVSTDSFTLTTPEGDKTVTTSDATSFYRIRAGNRSEITFTNLKKGDDVLVIGTVDPQTTDMTAREIIAKIKRENIVGTITALKKYVATVKEGNGTETQINLSDAVSLKKIDPATGKTPVAKLADFKENSLVMVIAYVSGKDTDPLSALKAVVINK